MAINKTILLLIVLMLLNSILILGHPGRTDYYGCHTCRTNCEKWGLYYGQYHCHNSDGEKETTQQQIKEELNFVCSSRWMCIDSNYLGYRLSDCTYIFSTYCENGCENNECKPAQICTPNIVTCNGNWLKRCSSKGSKWDNYHKYCTYGCSNGQCISEGKELNPLFFKVISIVDGDTIKVQINGKIEKVRLLGIDSPEIYRKKQCFGKEASSKIREMVKDRLVRLEKDSQQPDRDRSGRLLRYVYLEDSTLVNEEMVKQGYAVAYTKYNTDKLERFIELEANAKRQRVGLWGYCTMFSGQSSDTNED